MLHRCRPALLLIPLLALSLTAAAQPSPVGRWKTLDEKTGKARAIVRIYEKDGQLQGDVAQILEGRPGAPTNEAGQVICTRCEGPRKNAPIEGLNIIWGLKREGNVWTGGRILDPEHGDVYRAKMWLEDGKLHVRGFLGVSLLGRTQTWVRAEG